MILIKLISPALNSNINSFRCQTWGEEA